MLGKSLCLCALAGALIWSAAAQAAPGETASSVSLIAARTTAKGDKVPELDMRPGCRGAASEDLDLADNKPTIESCRSEEQAARHTLDGIWSTFSVSDKHECTAATEGGGPPSYINLLWCLKDGQLAHQLEQKPAMKTAR